MARLFAELPEAVRNTLAIAERCQARVQLAAYRFPDFPLPPGETPDSFLAARCQEGALARYGHADGEVGEKLRYELGLIQRHGLAGYFLIVWDLMALRAPRARPRPGARLGRQLDRRLRARADERRPDPPRAVRRALPERGATTLPDIDIDFSREHREQVLQYVSTTLRARARRRWSRRTSPTKRAAPSATWARRWACRWTSWTAWPASSNATPPKGCASCCPSRNAEAGPPSPGSGAPLPGARGDPPAAFPGVQGNYPAAGGRGCPPKIPTLWNFLLGAMRRDHRFPAAPLAARGRHGD